LSGLAVMIAGLNVLLLMLKCVKRLSTSVGLIKELVYSLFFVRRYSLSWI